MIKNGRLSEQQLKVTVTNLLTITFTTFQHHVLKIYHPRKNGPAIKHQNENKTISFQKYTTLYLSTNF